MSSRQRDEYGHNKHTRLASSIQPQHQQPHLLGSEDLVENLGDSVAHDGYCMCAAPLGLQPVGNFWPGEVVGHGAGLCDDGRWNMRYANTGRVNVYGDVERSGGVFVSGGRGWL
jgi:hypothetical protein